MTNSVIPTEAEVIAYLDQAIRTLREQDWWLLRNDASERSITHRLAIYIENAFGGRWDVDCEYNRDHKVQKVLVEQREILRRFRVVRSGFRRNIRRNPRRPPLEMDEVAISVYPDIIVHKRTQDPEMLDMHNIMVVEVKKSTNPLGRDGDEFDFFKLDKFKDQLHYNYAIFIKFFTGTEVINFEVFIMRDNGRRERVL